ncbi:unnamed protein product [Sphagnum jensenii]|uniref:carbamoyl-phosphate synthase (ammonia) n=1 Tax=Sphagnum jensenii TaxID=128206 RepID=A0ABP0VG12_9BRYO
MGLRSTMINYNPETVSTDYDECDQLYFEELSRERVLDIYSMEQATGVVVSMGGQIPNNLALPLSRAGVAVMGTSPTQIDRAEDRQKFSRIIDELGLQQAEWRELADMSGALRFAEKVGYPVLVRPSYVLSGAAMNVAYTPERLAEYLREATGVSPDHPVVVSKFISGGREIEMDGVASEGVVRGCAIHEHVENAGVHSGDATLMLPTQTVSEFVLAKVEEATRRIVRELHITGVDFIEAATRLMVGASVADMNLPQLGTRNRPSGYVGVKAPMFSFTRLGGADPVACFGADVHEAFLKALMSTGFKIPQRSIAFTVPAELLEEVVHHIWLLHTLGFSILATDDTHAFLSLKGIPTELVHFANSTEQPNIKTLISLGQIDLVVNLPTSSSTELRNNFLTRRTAVDFGVPLLTDPQLFRMFAEALVKHKQGRFAFSQVSTTQLDTTTSSHYLMPCRLRVSSTTTHGRNRRKPGPLPTSSIRHSLMQLRV